MSRIFDTDPALSLTRFWHWDDEKDQAVIETRQDVTDLLDANRAEANEASGNWRGDMHKVASIPLNVYYDLKQKGIIDDAKAFKRWLNDPENRYFRTKGGRV
jgi:hypothetical protein